MTNQNLDDQQMMKSLLARGLKLPPQPKVVQELLQCQARGETNIRVLARIITQDAGTTALMFRVVQSPVYREHQPFTSVENILQLVGISQVINIVQAVALAMASSTRANRATYEQFWANSTAIGCLAMLIAEDRISVCNVFPDEAYLAGIFHDCGVPLLMERFPNYCRNMDLQSQLLWSNIAIEDNNYQTNHAVVGFFVAKHWKLPEFICDALRFHHDLLELENHRSRSLVAILQMAFHLYCLAMRRSNPEWADCKQSVLDELGLDEQVLGEFTDEILDQFQVE